MAVKRSIHDVGGKVPVEYYGNQKVTDKSMQAASYENLDWDTMKSNLPLGEDRLKSMTKPKSSGIEIRGCKNTTRGKMSRGPMA